MSETTATQQPTIHPIPEGLAERAALLGGPEGILADEQIAGFVTEQQFYEWIVPIDMTRPDTVE